MWPSIQNDGGYQSVSSLWLVERGVGALATTIGQSGCQSEIRSASESLGTPTQPLHPPRAWHPIVRSCVSSTVRRCASASS